MMWRKEFGLGHATNTDFGMLTLLLTSFIALFFKHPALYLFIGVFAAYLVLNVYYNRSLGEQLTLKNEPKVIRLFPGEETVLHFDFQNRSIYPMVNGHFQFRISTNVGALNYEESFNKHWHNVHMPLSIISRGATTLKLPIWAKHRGTTRINNITFEFPHLFNFKKAKLYYMPFYHAEILVYPKIIPIHGIDTAFHMTPGLQRQNMSVFEDVLSPVGTREYSYSDPFHQINWKASAKTQELQTNVYEKVVDMSYVFMLNINKEQSDVKTFTNDHLEELISYTAFLCQYATKHHIPYEICVNMWTPGGTSYLHLSEGVGNNHFGNSLEMLARIRSQAMTIPFDQMVYHVDKQLFKPKTMIAIGEISGDAVELMRHWAQKRQSHVYHVTHTEDGAVISGLAKGEFKYAK